MHRTYFFLAFSLLFFSNCKVQQYTPSTFPDSKITLGNGGGFTGLVTEFTILENGQVFVKKPTSDVFEELQKLDKNVVAQLFNNYTVLKLNEVTLEQSGNMYSYIDFNNGTKSHKMMWGDGEAPIPNVNLFYSIAKSLIKDENPIK